MYTVLRYLAPPLLESTGTRHFDAWAASFDWWAAIMQDCLAGAHATSPLHVLRHDKKPAAR
jgi:N12 class adenine-specific DNA methylase